MLASCPLPTSAWSSTTNCSVRHAVGASVGAAGTCRLLRVPEHPPRTASSRERPPHASALRMAPLKPLIASTRTSPDAVPEYEWVTGERQPRLLINFIQNRRYLSERVGPSLVPTADNIDRLMRAASGALEDRERRVPPSSQVPPGAQLRPRPPAPVGGVLRAQPAGVLHLRSGRWAVSAGPYVLQFPPRILGRGALGVPAVSVHLLPSAGTHELATRAAFARPRRGCRTRAPVATAGRAAGLDPEKPGCVASAPACSLASTCGRSQTATTRRYCRSPRIAGSRPRALRTPLKP